MYIYIIYIYDIYKLYKLCVELWKPLLAVQDIAPGGHRPDESRAKGSLDPLDEPVKDSPYPLVICYIANWIMTKITMENGGLMGLNGI